MRCLDFSLHEENIGVATTCFPQLFKLSNFLDYAPRGTFSITHVYVIPIVGVRKRGARKLVLGDA